MKQFGHGAVIGVVVTAFVLALLQTDPNRIDPNTALQWTQRNLGHSVWLFAAVLMCYLANLAQLKAATSRGAETSVVLLDQLTDVWIQLFIGIGVVWTAIGMRAALQAALADTATTLGDTASLVLERLVEGGILLALTTTIVGGFGGYLMRLGKTLSVGAALQDHYHAASRRELTALLASVERIESHMDTREALPEASQTVDKEPSRAAFGA